MSDQTVTFPRLLRAADVAAILEVPVSTVQHWAIRGEGPPSFKVGKHRRWVAEDVAAWLDSARRVPA
ncbi:MAG TPA: helix-turn-helix domain-containing protein [Dermatophilaceae bacterium]|nr:helix-turn-helix domain-containing protein [Dermatophilaceae bacterium]